MNVIRKDDRIIVELTLKEAAAVCHHRTRDGWLMRDPVERTIADPVFAKTFRTKLALAIRRTGIFDKA